MPKKENKKEKRNGENFGNAVLNRDGVKLLMG